MTVPSRKAQALLALRRALGARRCRVAVSIASAAVWSALPAPAEPSPPALVTIDGSRLSAHAENLVASERSGGGASGSGPPAAGVADSEHGAGMASLPHDAERARRVQDEALRAGRR